MVRLYAFGNSFNAQPQAPARLTHGKSQCRRIRLAVKQFDVCCTSRKISL